MTGCIDGGLDTQPLYVKNVRRFPPFFWFSDDMVFLATVANSVYGVSANTGQILWRTQLGASDRVMTVARGVRATPVIDSAHNRMYVLFGTKNGWGDQPLCADLNSADPHTKQGAVDMAKNLTVAYWLAVLDIRTGAVLQEVPVTGQVKRSDGRDVHFVPKNHLPHPGLLLDRGSVYVAFGAPAWAEGCLDYHGWVMRYDASNLAQRAVFNTSVDSTVAETEHFGGSGIWQGGGGLAADADGNVYFTTGNGLAGSTMPADSHRRRTLFGDAILKLSPAGTTFNVTPFFPDEADVLQNSDGDLGSGGTLVIPGSNLVMGGGKSGFGYVLNRTNMRLTQQLTATTNWYAPWLRGETWNLGPHLHGALTYWRGPDLAYDYLYVWGEKDVLRQFRFKRSTQQFEKAEIRKGKIAALRDTMPGGMMSLSANGNSRGSGVLWATLPLASKPTPHPGVLYAFDAENLDFLWDTSFGYTAHWVPPTIADGKVFIAEGGEPQAGSQMFIAYELGSPEGSDRSGRDPLTPPQVPQACQSCHNSGPMLKMLMEPMAMSDFYTTGGAMPALPALRLAALTPPEGLKQTVLLEGNGMQVYEAEPRADGSELVWVPEEDTAELTEVPSTEALKTGRASIKAQLSGNGLVWSGSDGSVAVGSVDRIAPAPEGHDEDWVLYRVVENRGHGVLSGQGYVQRVFTHAGRAPREAPTSRGAIVRVPHYAQYWFYSAVDAASPAAGARALVPR
jgi:outer membrane protein assembly factor BamB